jgi:ribonucleoside-diphosphate reductase alpha chain
MINEIIKRDGSREPFNAVKVNGWGIWASESLSDFVDWSGVVMAAVSSLPESCTSSDLQYALIKECIDRDTWSYNRMAGRLYAAIMYKEIYPQGIPTVKVCFEASQAATFMAKLDYSDEEYALAEEMIQHHRDFGYPHFQLYHIRFKYALRDRLKGNEFETPQFVYMRMAMALAEDQPLDRRMNDVKEFYDRFSKNMISAPTPNYTNLGTPLNGYASCCLYASSDTANSLAAGDHIAYKMTVQSAGIGNILHIRSNGDPVRGGVIIHQGKLPYLRAMNGAVRANMQNGRAGACNSFFSAFDPEVETLQALKNPMTPISKQIRDMDYTMHANKFLGRKAARDEDIMQFNVFTAPDLYNALFSPDLSEFETLYTKYEADPNFKKNYISARKVVLNNRNEGFETGRAYVTFIDEINRHTPCKDPIYSSNLCVEIVQHTRPYESVEDLYSRESVGYIKFKDQYGAIHEVDATRAVKLASGKFKLNAAQELKVGDIFDIPSLSVNNLKVGKILELKKEPEVALCSLGAIVASNVSDEEYEKTAYYSLLMVDKCIHKSDYTLPHIGYTAKNRMSAGIGIMDLAHYMAKKGLKYSSQEGKEEIHRVAERHAYYCIKASLKLGRELGNAPWIHRTKWSEGWLPIDSRNQYVPEKIVPNVKLQYDWEELRSQIIENGGIRNSFVIAFMPGETSSKAAGTANSLYPVRDTTLIKTDNNIATYWAAPDSDKLAEHYELAWNIPTKDLIDVYGIFQGFTDQSISADLYRHIRGAEKVTTDEMLENFFHMIRVGMKSQYYMNVKSAKKVVLKKADDTGAVMEDLSVSMVKTREAEYLGIIEKDNSASTESQDNADTTYVDVENTAGLSAGCDSGACSL